MQFRPPLAAVLFVLVLGTGCIAVPGAIGDDVGDSSGALAPQSPDDDSWTVTVHDREDGVGQSNPVEVDGDLPVNATRTYRRVERLLGADAPAPSVEVERPDQSIDRLPRPSPSLRALGFSNRTGNVEACGSLGSGSAGGGSVRVSTVDPSTGEPLSNDTIELVLAHEYAHVLWQDREDSTSLVDQPDPTNLLLFQAEREGHAVATAESYARAYDLRWEGQRPMELRWCLYEQSQGSVRLLSSSYYFGGRYYLRTMEGTGELMTAVERPPPNSTEQLIHPERRGDDQPMPLSVDAATSSEWERAPARGYPGVTAGEATVRVWLDAVFDRDRVDEAATGWGNGTAVTYRSTDDPDARDRSRGTVWVLRWDSEADATEFEDAARDASGPLEEQANTTLSVERVSPDTVIVAGGPASFVDGLEASGSDGSISLAPPGADGGSTND